VRAFISNYLYFFSLKCTSGMLGLLKGSTDGGEERSGDESEDDGQHQTVLLKQAHRSAKASSLRKTSVLPRWHLQLGVKLNLLASLISLN